jgi:hypothetical protein
MPDFDANDGLASLPGAAPGGRVEPALALSALARYLDVPLVIVLTPVALALGAPLLGCVVGAAAWLGQRALAQLDRRWIAGAREPRTQLGLNVVEAFGRIWLLVGAIILAAVAAGRSDGLAAALTLFAAYSVAFVIRLLSGRPEPIRPREAVR